MTRIRQADSEAADAGPPSVPWFGEWHEITDPAVRAAFARVDRARFVPPDLRDQADRDAPLPIGEGQTISQPFVIALMVQALELSPGSRVLEVGTGSGYQTAILCEMARQPQEESGESVFTVERYESLMHRAARALTEGGYHPHMRLGDGVAGWPGAAPFDGIVVSAASRFLPRPLVEQLAFGGRLVIPVGGQGDEQTLWLVIRDRSGLRGEQLGPVRFVPLISPLLDDPANRLKLP